MYVYIQSEPQLWTTGFYDPKGKWHSDNDYDTKAEAAKRVSELNGNASRNKMLLALEFGYKQCEKGENLEAAIINSKL